MAVRPRRVATPAVAVPDRDAVLVAIVLPCTTFAILGYEIVLTRLFAYVFTYELTALAVSFAMFGLGAGAYVRVRWLSFLPGRTLAVVAHLAAGASLLALYVALLLTHAPAVIIVVSALPFVFAGVAASHYYEVRRADRASSTYALDLSGAAVACIASVPLLVGAGADGALLLLAALAGGTAAVASIGVDPPARGPALVLAVLCAVLPCAAYAFRSAWADPLLNRHSSVEKQLPRLLRERGRVVDTAWSAVGRADLFQAPGDVDKAIFADATNASVFLADVPDNLQGLFAALPFVIAPVRSALVLGSGAGLEVEVARKAGVADIEAVELNDAIVRLVRRWREFGGPVYDRPGVSLFVDEARKFVLTRPRRYDLIQMSLVLTASAQSATYALAEGYLYTVEAFRSYLDHLEPGGALAIIDDSFERTLKNTVTAVAVLEHGLGLSGAEAMQRIAVVFNARESEAAYKYLLLVSPAPLSTDRTERLVAEVPGRALQFFWLPGVASAPSFRALATSGADAFVRTASMNVEPPTDDKPYLNDFAKTPADVVELLWPYLTLSAVMLAVLTGMFASDTAGRRRPTALAASYGVGFVLVELGLLHKLTLAVGGPTYVLSVLLFGLLAYCGLGSLVSGRCASSIRPRIGSFAIVVAVVAVVTAAVIERCYLLQGVSSSALRIVCVLAIVLPIGISLGAPFPDLLRRYGRSDDRRLAYLWAVNGVGAVLGGSLTLSLTPVLGVRAVLLAGSAVYLLAWRIDRRAELP